MPPGNHTNNETEARRPTGIADHRSRAHALTG